MLVRPSRHINFFVALAAMSACFLYLLNRTWMKWGDLIVDTFRECWIPMRLLEGSVLYRDIFYEYGLFPPYFQAFLFKIFGPHLNTLVGLGIVITLLVSAALYLISRMFLNVAVSALTVIVFFLAFAFNHYACNNNFNFILPYSFASTFFLMFILYAVYFFLRFIQSGKYARLLCWALCLSMAMFCRVEQPLLVWTGFLATGILYAVKNPEKNNIRLWIILFLPVAASITGYCLFISFFDAWEGFKESVIDPALFMKNDPFQEIVMGTENVRASLKAIGTSLFWTIILFPLLGVSSAAIAGFFKSPSSPALPLIGIAGIFLIFFYTHDRLNTIQYHCLSLFLAAGASYYGWRFLKKTNVYHLQMFCLFLSALLMNLRIILNMGPGLYGFYLLIPGLICYHIIIFKIIGSFLTRSFPALPAFALNAIFIAFLLFPAADFWTWSDAYYEKRTADIVSDKGRFKWFDDARTQAIFLTINWLRQNVPPEATAAVFPEGIGINFLADRKNPLKYCNFMPPVLQYIGHEKLIKDLAAKNVDYVIVIGRDASDYGHPFFGIHYAQNLFAWIQEHYCLEQVIGAMPFETERFGVAVYRKIS